MNNKVVGLLSFAVGASAGVLGTWRYFKSKYEQIATEEIASVKDVLTKRYEKDINEGMDIAREEVLQGVEEMFEKAAKAKNKPDLLEYAAKTNYTAFSESKSVKKKEPEPEELDDKPYIISPNEFGEDEDYERITLMYYADNVLTDDMDEPVEDVDRTVGIDSLTRFGEYEADTVFVRNDRIKADIEIIKDNRNYEDVVNGR